MSPILGLHRHESQAVRDEPNIDEPQPRESPNWRFNFGASGLHVEGVKEDVGRGTALFRR